MIVTTRKNQPSSYRFTQANKKNGYTVSTGLPKFLLYRLVAFSSENNKDVINSQFFIKYYSSKQQVIRYSIIIIPWGNEHHWFLGYQAPLVPGSWVMSTTGSWFLGNEHHWFLFPGVPSTTGTWFLGYSTTGSWFLDTQHHWFLVPGYQVPLVPGSWGTEHQLVPGSWDTEHHWFLVPGSWGTAPLVPGSWFLGYSTTGSWFLGTEHHWLLIPGY